MSPTRKAKPPDKGAPPEHKPSRKVALEEVMRSLQDLVSNELAIEPEQQPDKATASATKKSRATSKQPTAHATSPLESDADSTEITLNTESITLKSLPLTETTTTGQRTTSKQAIPPGGLQQELPYLDSTPPVASDLQPSSVTPGIPADGTATDLDAQALSDSATLPTTAESSAAPDDFNWDDIPILDEAVDILEETEINEPGQALSNRAAASLLPADAARRLAIQVAARLNVELRKSGQVGLSSDIITRLARLLQEALAKSVSNMENNTPDKH
jgi:hypothetical protein